MPWVLFFWSCTVAVMVQMFGDIACHCVSGLLREYVFHLFILTPSLCVLRSWNVVMQHYTISLCRLNQLLNTSGHLTQLTILCRTTCVSASEWKIKWVQRDNYTNSMGSFDALKRNCKNRIEWSHHNLDLIYFPSRAKDERTSRVLQLSHYSGCPCCQVVILAPIYFQRDWIDV